MPRYWLPAGLCVLAILVALHVQNLFEVPVTGPASSAASWSATELDVAPWMFAVTAVMALRAARNVGSNHRF